jgi:alginate O-acetyltransferase complex protein AlgI
MLFNSIEFAVFLPIVFALYWIVPSKQLRWRNLVLLLASYVFYGWWDWRFLGLVAFSSFVDYIVGRALGPARSHSFRRSLLLVSVGVNIGFLGFFKYFNFFAENFYAAFTLFGQPVADPIRLSIILPVGISFYTFQTLSYSIDVYRRKMEPTEDPVAFFAFVSFFPQLVAGPIERAAHLLPQFLSTRRFSYEEATDGMRLILWGLCKKIVIADVCAVHVNTVFGNPGAQSGSTLLLGAVFFAFQIYGDFSGYSDIAIGCAKLFGFRLTRNFAYPYFSRDIAEFWRRWHISLSSWFRDYVYIPMGGSRCGPWRSSVNIIVVFVVSGFWHGANWTFIVWGLINALFILPLVLLRRHRVYTNQVAQGRLLPSPLEIMQMAGTFGITVIAWVFFRSESLAHAQLYLQRMFSPSLFSIPQTGSRWLLLSIVVMVGIEWIQRARAHPLDLVALKIPRVLRWPIYYALLLLIYVHSGSPQDFIYFQF